MKHQIIKALVCTFMAATLGFGANAQSTNVDQDLLVTMPVPSDKLERLDQRCNFIIDNYWKTFNPKSSFSHRDRLDHTLGTFFGFTPYATADTVHAAIDYLISNVSKASPNNLITLAQIAEKWCGNDTAEYASEELYFPFVEAVATNKKVKGPERAHFEHQYKQLQASRLGVAVPDFSFITVNGTEKHLSDIKTPHILLFFYDPDCMDCSLAKARLSADYVIQYMIRHKVLSIVALYPGVADGQWRDNVASMPQGWIVAAMPDADDYFNITNKPNITYLDPDRVVRVKNVQVDNIISAFRQMLEQMLQSGDNTDDGTQTEEAPTPTTAQ